MSPIACHLRSFEQDERSQRFGTFSRPCVTLYSSPSFTVSSTTTFKPVHQQPVTLQQLIELEPELLTAGERHFQSSTGFITVLKRKETEASRLQNSLSHLERSNRELQACLVGDDDDLSEELDPDERAEFEASIKENEVVM